MSPILLLQSISRDDLMRHRWQSINKFIFSNSEGVAPPRKKVEHNYNWCTEILIKKNILNFEYKNDCSYTYLFGMLKFYPPTIYLKLLAKNKICSAQKKETTKETQLTHENRLQGF